jgi:hypothetical protein
MSVAQRWTQLHVNAPQNIAFIHPRVQYQQHNQQITRAPLAAGTTDRFSMNILPSDGITDYTHASLVQQATRSLHLRPCWHTAPLGKSCPATMQTTHLQEPTLTTKQSPHHAW